MKKIIMILCLSLLALVGCQQTESTEKVNESVKDKKKIVVTTFPQYDWVKEILGEKASEFDVDLLLDSGVDLHNFDPTVSDIANIGTSDLFIYVGGHSDAWVDEMLESDQTFKESKTVINLMTALGELVQEENMVEGMQHVHDHDHDAHEEEHEDHDAHEEEHEDHDAHEEEHEDHVEHELDEHIWLSLKNANVLCRSIADAIIQLDPENEELYEKNYEAYSKKLIAMDLDYKDMVESSSYKTVVFADRFPFQYMMNDYGIDYYAAFSGCSAEAEASFETVVFLGDKIKELDLQSLCVIEGDEKNIATSVINNNGNNELNIVAMNSLQSVTQKDVEGGITYLAVMKDNMERLKEALNSYE